MCLQCIGALNIIAARRALAEVEKSLAKSTEDLKKALKSSERRVKELEKELHQEGRESSETNLLSQRLAAELEDEREQHQKDLVERDFTMDQTRKKYQGMLCRCHNVKDSALMESFCS